LILLHLLHLFFFSVDLVLVPTLEFQAMSDSRRLLACVDGSGQPWIFFRNQNQGFTTYRRDQSGLQTVNFDYLSATHGSYLQYNYIQAFDLLQRHDDNTIYLVCVYTTVPNLEVLNDHNLVPVVIVFISFQPNAIPTKLGLTVTLPSLAIDVVTLAPPTPPPLILPDEVFMASFDSFSHTHTLSRVPCQQQICLI
jgi:hypothetical protein